MKPFNLEEYLKNPNREVVTRDGRKVRVLCTDRKDITPIIALVNDGLPDCKEFCYSFFPDGKTCENYENVIDLFFAPTKHEGWINLYYFGVERTTDGDIVYDTEQDAKRNVHEYSNYIGTIKIEWEE